MPMWTGKLLSRLATFRTYRLPRIVVFASQPDFYCLRCVNSFYNLEIGAGNAESSKTASSRLRGPNLRDFVGSVPTQFNRIQPMYPRSRPDALTIGSVTKATRCRCGRPRTKRRRDSSTALLRLGFFSQRSALSHCPLHAWLLCSW